MDARLIEWRVMCNDAVRPTTHPLTLPTLTLLSSDPHPLFSLRSQEAELDHYELDLDQRYTSSLCVWVPERQPTAALTGAATDASSTPTQTGGHIAAISLWQLTLDFVSLALLKSVEPPARVYFACTSADGTCRCARGHHTVPPATTTRY